MAQAKVYTIPKYKVVPQRNYLCMDRLQPRVRVASHEIIWELEKDGRTLHFSAQYGQVGRGTARTATEVNYGNQIQAAE